MPFLIHLYRCFPVQCSVTYYAGSLPRAGYDLESLRYRLATFRRSAHVLRGNPLTHRDAHE
jgi:hypothetical protein